VVLLLHQGKVITAVMAMFVHLLNAVVVVVVVVRLA
jgi:hypothetical protein